MRQCPWSISALCNCVHNAGGKHFWYQALAQKVLPLGTVHAPLHTPSAGSINHWLLNRPFGTSRGRRSQCVRKPQFSRSPAALAASRIITRGSPANTAMVFGLYSRVQVDSDDDDPVMQAKSTGASMLQGCSSKAEGRHVMHGFNWLMSVLAGRVLQGIAYLALHWAARCMSLLLNCTLMARFCCICLERGMVATW